MLSPRSINRKIEELKRRLNPDSHDELAPLSFADFLDLEFMPAVGEIEGDIVSAPHLRKWADLVERNRFVALIAFRGSLKSTFAKAVIAHALREHRRGAFDAVLYSATVDLARWHLRRLKLYVESLAAQWGWTDTTAGEAILRYEKPGAIFACEPAGLDQASRGRRGNLLVLDDVSDPKKLTSMADIERALEALQRRILPLLKDKKARVLLVGTPLIEGDVIAWAERNPEFVTTRLPALWPDGRPAWPEKFPLEELDRFKHLLGEAAFRAEYLLEPAGPTDSYINPELYHRALIWDR